MPNLIGTDDERSLGSQHAGTRALPGTNTTAQDEPDRLRCIEVGTHDMTVPLSVDPRPDSWVRRFDWILAAVAWITLVLGILLTVLVNGITPLTLTAATVAGVYVVALQVTPRRIRDGGVGAELFAVGGVLVALVAVALTGGLDSAYTLFLTVPVFYAAAFSGFRLGVTTALLATTGLAVVAASLGQDILQPGLVQTAALLVLLAITFAQARYILVEERRRTSELERTSLLNATKLERLSTAHTLLVSLSDLADSAELNPVTIGQAALRDLAGVVPFAAGTVAIRDNDGGHDITVARRGVPGSTRASEYRISLGDRTTGCLTLWPQSDGDLDDQEDLVQEALRPVALAFDNIQLIRDIAGRAVHEERVRVARELHDEVAPSLASLGLGIDMAIHQHEMNPELARHLETLRQRLAGLIEDVRRIVADLRAHDDISLMERAYTLAAETRLDGSEIRIELSEHRPPRAAIAAELAAILTEAVRNAVEHADATEIEISGFVDRDEGRVAIADNGRGFDAAVRPRDHFGLVGMKERATAINAHLAVESLPSQGSTITIEWGT